MTVTKEHWADTIGREIDRKADWHDGLACPDTIAGILDAGPAPEDVVPSNHVWVLEEMHYTVEVFATPEAAAARADVMYPRPHRSGIDRWVVDIKRWTERAGDSSRGLRIQRYEVQS